MKFIVSYCRDLRKTLSLSHLLTIQFCQSFAFYGIKSVLVLYLTQELGLKDVTSLRLYGNFMGFLYLAPLLGGILIDRYWSPQVSMIWGIGASTLGAFLITLSSHEALYIGAAFIVVGQGFFKPVVPFLLDDSYKKSGYSRESSYTIYYILINIGGAISPLLCGFVRYYYGWTASLLVMVGMGVLGLFLVRQVRSEDESKKLTPVKFWISMVSVALSVWVLSYILKSPHVVDQLVLYSLPVIGCYFFYIYACSREKLRIFFIFLSLVILVFFVSIFEQSGGSITLFLERHVDRNLWASTVIPTSTFQSLNPFMVIILGSFMSYLWSKTTHQSRELSALLRLSLGFFLAMVGFYILWYVSSHCHGDVKVSAWWVVLAIAFHTLGELCIVPMTLSLITHLAPSKMKGTAIGMWCLSIAYGHYLSSWLSSQVVQGHDESIQGVATFQDVFLVASKIAFGWLGALLLLKGILRFLAGDQTRNSLGNYKI